MNGVQIIYSLQMLLSPSKKKLNTPQMHSIQLTFIFHL